MNRSGLKGEMTVERTNIPAWAVWMFGIAQPIVVTFLVFVSRMMWNLNENVTILNVKMETALETDDKLDTINDRINLISGRLARLEAIEDRRTDQGAER